MHDVTTIRTVQVPLEFDYSYETVFGALLYGNLNTHFKYFRAEPQCKPHHYPVLNV